MSTVTIEEAQATLPELIARLSPGEVVQITDHGNPVARIVAEKLPPRKRRQPGSAVGKLIVLSEDDEHLQDFREYMP